MNYSALIRNCEVFGGLDDEACSAVSGMAESVELPRAQLIFQQGEPAKGLYILHHGAVGIRTSLGAHVDVLVETVTRPGEIFGWSSLVEPHVYAFSARAQEQGIALFIPREPLAQLMEARPEAGMVIYRGLTQTIVRRLHQTRSSLMSVMSTGLINQG